VRTPVPAAAAAVRIIANPATTTGLDEEQRALLLRHEGVHVATAGLGAPAASRVWVSEGLAESVALSADRAGRAAHWHRLRADCSVLAHPPADAGFRVASGLVGDAAEHPYAEAWAWVTTIQQLRGTDDAQEDLARLWRGEEAAGYGLDEIALLATRRCRAI